MPSLARAILSALPGLPGRRPEPPSLVVVGLGNPGPEYADTPHNLGFRLIDRLSGEHSIALSRRQRSAVVGDGEIEGHRVALAKPRTFVNRSGDAVRYLLARFRVAPGALLVVYDEIALEPGRIRLRTSGSAGGHNGVASIIETLGTQAFPRLRIGIGPPPEGVDQIDYLLSPMSDDRRASAAEALKLAAEAVVCHLTQGITTAMNRYN